MVSKGTIDLTLDQIAIGVDVQNHIDAFGFCLYPSWMIRKTFGTSTEGLKWLATNNLWELKYDSVLDLMYFKDTVPDDQKPFSIRKLQKQLRQHERSKSRVEKHSS